MADTDSEARMRQEIQRLEAKLRERKNRGTGKGRQVEPPALVPIQNIRSTRASTAHPGPRSVPRSVPEDLENTIIPASPTVQLARKPRRRSSVGRGSPQVPAQLKYKTLSSVPRVDITALECDPVFQFHMPHPNADLILQRRDFVLPRDYTALKLEVKRTRKVLIDSCYLEEEKEVISQSLLSSSRSKRRKLDPNSQSSGSSEPLTEPEGSILVTMSSPDLRCSAIVPGTDKFTPLPESYPGLEGSAIIPDSDKFTLMPMSPTMDGSPQTPDENPAIALSLSFPDLGGSPIRPDTKESNVLPRSAADVEESATIPNKDKAIVHAILPPALGESATISAMDKAIDLPLSFPDLGESPILPDTERCTHLPGPNLDLKKSATRADRKIAVESPRSTADTVESTIIPDMDMSIEMPMSFPDLGGSPIIPDTEKSTFVLSSPDTSSMAPPSQPDRFPNVSLESCEPVNSPKIRDTQENDGSQAKPRLVSCENRLICQHNNESNVLVEELRPISGMNSVWLNMQSVVVGYLVSSDGSSFFIRLHLFEIDNRTFIHRRMRSIHVQSALSQFRLVLMDKILKLAVITDAFVYVWTKLQPDFEFRLKPELFERMCQKYAISVQQ